LTEPGSDRFTELASALKAFTPKRLALVSQNAKCLFPPNNFTNSIPIQVNFQAIEIRKN
jgi:hypothetical protein